MNETLSRTRRRTRPASIDDGRDPEAASPPAPPGVADRRGRPAGRPDPPRPDAAARSRRGRRAASGAADVTGQRPRHCSEARPAWAARPHASQSLAPYEAQRDRVAEPEPPPSDRPARSARPDGGSPGRGRFRRGRIGKRRESDAGALLSGAGARQPGVGRGGQPPARRLGRGGRDLSRSARPPPGVRLRAPDHAHAPGDRRSRPAAGRDEVRRGGVGRRRLLRRRGRARSRPARGRVAAWRCSTRWSIPLRCPPSTSPSSTTTGARRPS